MGRWEGKKMMLARRKKGNTKDLKMGETTLPGLQANTGK